MGKLVRDKIPDIIRENDGFEPNTRVLNEEEYQAALGEKVLEEAAELKAARTRQERLVEMADLREVIAAIAAQDGISEDEIEHLRKVRREERGGFEDRIYLEP